MPDTTAREYEAIFRLAFLLLLTLAMVGLGFALRRNCTWNGQLTRRRRGWAIAGIIVTQIWPLPILGAVIFFWCVCLLTMAFCRLSDLKRIAVAESKTAGAAN